MANEKNIKIARDTDLVADRFTIDTPYLDHFLNKKEDFEIKEGYGENNIVVFSGKADEWVIEYEQGRFNLSVSGRDNLKLALETYFKKSYFLYQPLVEPTTEYDEAIPYQVGVTMASTVAQQACTAAGLSVVWGCPDYPVVNSVEPSQGYSGYVADILKQLVEPFQHTRMFQVDIYAEGTTVYLKRRIYPYTADETMSITDARIKRMQLNQVDADLNKNIRKIFFSREEAQDTLTILQRYETKLTETKDSDGNVLTRTVSTKLLKLEVCVSEVIETFKLLNPSDPATSSLVLTNRSTITYDFGGIISTNYQKLRKTVETFIAYNRRNRLTTYKAAEGTKTKSFTYSSDDEILVEDEIIEKTAYDELGSTISQVYDDDGNLLATTETVQNTITHEKISRDLIQTTITAYKNGELKNTQTITQAGQLPGPKRVGSNRNASSNTGDTTTWHDSITVSDSGEDIEISNNLLSREQLRTEAGYIKTENAATKYEVDLDVLPMPWLGKAQGLRFTGTIKDGFGNDFDLGTLIFRIERVETRMGPKEYIGTIRGTAWL